MAGIQECNAFVRANNNISGASKGEEIYSNISGNSKGEDNCSKPLPVKQMDKPNRNNDSTCNIAITDDYFKDSTKPSVKRKLCYRKKYLVMFIIALVVCMIVLLSLLVHYSQKKQINELENRNIPSTGKSVRGKEEITEGCDIQEGRKSFPDLDYALFGYNILRGYPLAVGHDPGLTHPIFAHSYGEQKHTADCRYHVPKGYVLAPDVSCVTSFSSKVVKDSSQFVKSLSVTAEASFGGWGASFSASTEYKDKTSIMSSSENVFIFSQAKCNYYFAMIDEVAPPPLHPSFVKMVNSLQTDDDCHKFFDYYGTHFLTYTLFGARFVYENKMSKTEYQKENSKSVNVALKASYAGAFSLNGGMGLTSEQQDMAKNFKQQVETSTITIGAPPPADGKTLTWASTVKDNPVPVQYKLDSILNLFNAKYMGNTDIDYQEKLVKLTAAKTSYCSKLLTEGEVNSCKQTLSGFVTFDGLFYGDKAFSVFQTSFEVCTKRCADSPDCQAASFSSNTYNCFLYRASNSTILSVHESDVAKTALFKDSLKLLDKTLYLKNVRFPTELARETSIHAGNSTECSEQCRMDNVCFSYSFRSGDVKINCLLFQEKTIVSNSLKYEKDALTAIHINYRSTGSF